MSHAPETEIIENAITMMNERKEDMFWWASRKLESISK